MEDFAQYGSGKIDINLAGVSAATALGMAVSMSGKSDDDIAAAMGWSEAVKNRVFSNKDYYPAFPNVPRFCRVVNNLILPRWIIENSAIVSEVYEPMDAATLLEDLRKVMHEASRVMEEGQKALEDWRVNPKEARRVLARINDLFTVSFAMSARLQARMEKKGAV